jgi:hypothetical protein
LYDKENTKRIKEETKQAKFVENQERQGNQLAQFGFGQMMFDFYTAPVM